MAQPWQRPPGGSSGRTGSSKGPILLVAGAGVVGLLAIVLALAAFFVIRGRGSSGDTRTPVTSRSATSTTAIVSAASPTAAATTPPTATTAPTATASQTATQVAVAGTPTAAPTPASSLSMQTLATPPPGYVEAILFSSHRGDVHDSEVYVMNMDGSGEREITSNRGHTWGPRFMPDGTGLVYSSTAPGEHTIHDAEGGGLTGTGNHDVYVAEFKGDCPPTCKRSAPTTSRRDTHPGTTAGAGLPTASGSPLPPIVPGTGRSTR